jgi:hypothetical protein
LIKLIVIDALSCTNNTWEVSFARALDGRRRVMQQKNMRRRYMKKI